MVLNPGRQQDWFLGFASSGLVRQRHVVLDLDAIDPRGDVRVTDFRAVGCPPRRGKLDVIGLPDQRRKTHVQVGCSEAIQRTATVVERIQRERVKHLALIAALQVQAAVTASLAIGGGHVGQSKFHVQVKVLEHRFHIRTLHQQAVLGHLGIGELIDVRSVEQHERIFGGRRHERGTRSLNSLELPDLVAFTIKQQARVLLDENRPGSAGEDDEIIRASSDHADRFGLELVLTRQSAEKRQRVELISADGTNLQPEQLRFIFARRDFPDELTHQRVTGFVFGWFGKGRAFAQFVFALIFLREEATLFANARCKQTDGNQRSRGVTFDEVSMVSEGNEQASHFN